MGRIKAIIVEDERLPRLALQQKLNDFARQVAVIDCCGTYESARASILQHKPDLLFLDIQLQGRTSIDLIKELAPVISLPYIIFTTAYDDRQYLMSAIKLQAVDYLLKPVGKEELAVAIKKMEDIMEKTAPAVSDESDKITFRTSAGRLIISPNDIAYIKAARNYAVLVGLHREEMLLNSLSALEQMLNPEVFVRIDRSTIVNKANLCQLNTRRPACIFKMTDGTEIELELTKVGTDTLLNIK